MSRNTTMEERRTRELLDLLADTVSPLPEEELARLAQTAGETERPPVPPLRRRSSLGHSRRALLVAATVALTLAAGVGIGRWLAPAEATQALVLPAVEPAFLPAEGWTVVDGGIAVPPGIRAAIAANVPVAADEPLELVPAGILDKLPAEGIVVVASARPGPADAARTPSASAGLRLGDAEAATLWHGPEGRERAYAEYVLRAERDGLDLDVRVYLGDAEPPARVLAEAQAQLDRLVVRAAASQVTMAVRPTVLNFGQAPAIWGAVSAGRAGEVVMLEMRECGTAYWRAVGAATTSAGGSWAGGGALISINGTIRARWNDHTSTPVVVRTRPGAQLQWRNGRYSASFVGVRSFWRKQVRIERFDPQTRRWVRVRDVRLTESGPSGNFIWSSAKFQLPTVRRGTQVRAVLSAVQSGPCYLAGVSNMVRR